MPTIELIVANGEPAKLRIWKMVGRGLPSVRQGRVERRQPIAQLADTQVVIAMTGGDGLLFDGREARTLQTIQRCAISKAGALGFRSLGTQAAILQ
ncbi:hypothetical protein D3C87_1152760 [compost metagenome]